MPDFLETKREEIEARRAELKPAVDEYQRLDAAVAALDGLPVTNGVAPVTAAPRRAMTGKPLGRPKGGGTRRAQALNLVTTTPGITIPEIAERIGIKQNYLYRVLPGLAKEGLIVKDGRGWRPAAAVAPGGSE